MARSFKFATTLALSLLLAPSFVCAMNNDNNATVPLSAEGKELAELKDVINALDPNQRAGVETLEQARGTANRLRQELAKKEAEAAQKASEKAAEADAQKTKAFDANFKCNGYSPARFLYTPGKDGNPEFSKKWAAIDAIVVATAITAAYFGTENGKSGIRWVLSFAPNTVISEERKVEWALEKEQKLAMQKEQAAARSSRIAQLKAEQAKLATAREAAAIKA